MRTKILVVLFALALSANLRAQVTIGELVEPAKGALLDLNKAVKGGLLLSNVALDNLYTIPSTFPGGAPANKSEFKGAMVYNINPANGIGAYVWNGTNWTPITENCKPLVSTQLSVTPSPPVMVKTGGTETFSVSIGTTVRCAGGETYTWSVTPAANTAVQTPSAAKTSITFTAAGTYKVKVAVSNRYSDPVSSAVSGETAVYVTDEGGVPAELYSENYDVAGPPCYDVYRSSTEPETGYTVRADSFASGYAKTYIFDYKGAYSDLQVSYEDPHGLVDHIIQPANTSKAAGSGKEPFTVVFKSGVKTSVPVSGRDTVKLLVNYKVGTDAKLTLRNIRIQDAACHCPARIKRSSDRWLTFACHNLGATQNIISDSQTLGREHHGNWYRFGATAVSMANTPAHDSNNTWDNTYYQSSGDWANNGSPPCPAGWRMPDIDELAAVINYGMSYVNNTLAYLGTWGDSKTNFSARLKVGDYLYLPAAGGLYDTGSMVYRGFRGHYWSSNATGPSTGWSRVIYFDSNGSTNTASTSAIYVSYGYSVRCVAVD
jgi:uncharacterized protein (TIGR02145 family)